MKPIMILTSLLTLSACGGGFFWFDGMSEPTEAEAETVVGGAETNPAVTNLPTELGDYDLTNVVLNSPSGDNFVFHLDSNNRIDTIENKTNGDIYNRQGDTDEFGSHNYGTLYTYNSFGGDIGLQYSDIGVLEADNLSDTRLFVGGYGSKQEISPTDVFDGSYPVFEGKAIAKISRVDDPSMGIIVATDKARFVPEDEYYHIYMPFHSHRTSGEDYYDVTFYSKGSGGLSFENYDGVWRWSDDSGSGASIHHSYLTEREYYYGDAGTTREITGYMSTQSQTGDDGALTNFEAVYGMKRQ